MRLALVLLLTTAPALAQRGDHAGEAQPDLPADLQIPDSPALSPADVLATFALVEPDLTISLAAAEPMIVAPVSAAFDADGRLWVVEMQSYMPDIEGEGELAPTNRIVILEDLDDDWTFDRATTFLDGLVLPRSVLPCHDGALVIAPPNLIFARDTDGDGHADEQRTLASGFGGLDNPEHAGNGLLYGLDNWIHISQHNVEVSFDGETLLTRPTPAHGQWGITQDDRGRLYYCPNSDVLRADLFPKHYAARNPNQRALRGMNADLCPDKSVFPARITPGINRGYQDHMLRDDYTLAVTTAACSPLIYRSFSWGPDFYGNTFVCEPAGNCVMRLIVEEDEIGLPAARRAYTDTEFLTSTDERFRPVALATAPDGSLVVLDMYRGVIQHKTYVTTFLRKQVEARHLETPLHLGRIWRISPRAPRPSGAAPSSISPSPPSFSPQDSRLRTQDSSSPQVSSLEPQALIPLLSHPDAFYREHAQKLLVERRATDAIDPLRALATDISASPLARTHALWTLEGIGAISIDDALAATSDRDPALRAAAARLLDHWPDDLAAISALAQLSRDADRTTRLHSLLALGESRYPEANDALADALLDRADDPLVRSAILSGLSDREAVILALVAELCPHLPTEHERTAIIELATTCLRGSAAQRTRYLDLVAEQLDRSRPLVRILLDTLSAELKLDSDNPATLDLASEPTAWTTALSRGLWDLHPRALAITARLRWPGHDSPGPEVAPLILDQRELFRRGQRLYDVCAACHGFDGRGLAGQAPALAASPIATGPESRAVRVLLHGLEGPITRDDIEYNAQMPPAPFPADEDLAALLTYIRRSFGNTADPVSPDTVARTRALTPSRTTPWTEPELLSID